MQRFHQVLLIASMLVNSWLGMQLVHEVGHVLGAWLTGGRVARVVLHPLSFSRTDLADNPHPLPVVWLGPVFGALAPLFVWLMVIRFRNWPGEFTLRFFAGFCLIANGAYLAGGSFSRSGDCEVLLQQGAPIWQLWLFGGVTVPVGLWLWHGQSSRFGLGAAHGQVNHAVTYGSLAVSTALIVFGLWSATLWS